MLSDTFFNDISDMLERRCQLVHFVMTESDVVGKFTVVADTVERGVEVLQCLLVLALFEEDAAFVDDDIRVFLISLADQGFSKVDFVLLVADEHLEQEKFLVELFVLNALAGFEGFVIETFLV